MRRYNNVDNGNVKRFQYDDEDGFGRGFDARDRHALEAHARGSMKSTDGRFRDFPRRSREEELKRRSREGKDSVEEQKEGKEQQQQIVVKDYSNLVDSVMMMPNEAAVVKEEDSSSKSKQTDALGS